MHGWQIHIIMIFNCLRILTRAFVYISYFAAHRWRADSEIMQKSTSPDSILCFSMGVFYLQSAESADAENADTLKRIDSEKVGEVRDA